MSLVKELRTKKSRDNRELLDRAADEIERLQDSLRLAVAIATAPKGDGGIKQYGGYVEVTDVLDLPLALTNEDKVSVKGKYIDADELLNNLPDDLPYKASVKRVLIQAQPADVVPKSEVDKLEYTLTGVMHSVDKWLDGEELKQDEVNRAITMREKTLRIVEQYKDKLEDYKDCWYKIHDSYNADCLESYNKGRQKSAREIFEDMQSCLIQRHWNGLDIVTFEFDAVKYAELKKKYTESEDKK